MTQSAFDEAAFGSDHAPPRANGELVFAAPWEARAFALAVAIVDRHNLEWDEFRTRLVTAIAEDPDRPYFESWAVALESLVLDCGLSTSSALSQATPGERAPL